MASRRFSGWKPYLENYNAVTLRRPANHEVKDIVEYFESQSWDDPIKLTQHVTTSKVLGRVHEIWDVHAESGRWWVITNPTNLYPQADLPNYEMALTYHLGVDRVMAERSRGQLPNDELRNYFEAAFVRFEQAIEAFNHAAEAEEYQSVGLHCREALLTLVKDFAGASWLEAPDPKPQLGNFKLWNESYARSLTAGRTRTYLKQIGEGAWDLAVALQHRTGAQQHDADLVLQATSHYFSTVGLLVLALEERTEACPKCGSYRVGVDYDWDSNESHKVCGRCASAWNHEPISL